ncbi:MAG: glutaredoxin [Polyangiaceae bacterium]|nr:glutaredoxin [Polyangiaceae bacterium]
MTRNLLSPEAITPAALTAMGEFHASTVQEVIDAVKANPVVVVGMAQNPVVKKARKALDAAGVTYKYLEYGSYLGEWKRRLAIKLWSGWPTFPQVFVKGTLIGGNKELEASLADGSFRAKL